MVQTVLRYRDGKLYLEESSRDLKTRFNLDTSSVVDPLIGLYLVYSGEAIVLDADGKVLTIDDVVELCERSGRDVNTFFVFLDLVKKGKKVKPGVEGNELVLENEKLRIYVLDEDGRIGAGQLYDMVDKAIKQGYRTVIAIVDIHGDVVYYEVSKTDFPKIERKGDTS